MVTKSEQKIRKLFKSKFKLGEADESKNLRAGGSLFNKKYFRTLARSEKGLEKIKQLYDEITTDPKIQSIITGKTLSEALNFKSDKETEFVNNLESWIKNQNDESLKKFLEENLDLRLEDVLRESSGAGASLPEPPSLSETSSSELEEDKPIEKEKTPIVKAKVKAISPKTKAESKVGGSAETPSEPPTFSPDVMPSAKEAMQEEKKAQEEAKAERPTTGMTEEEEIELLDIPEKPKDNIKMNVKKREPTEFDKLQPLPSKSDFIPPMRLGTRGKDIKELLSDINYFFNNFKSQLKRESEIFKEVDKTNLDQLRKLHGRIVGKLAPKQKDEGKRVGIVVNADDYIREKMKQILQEQTFASIRPEDLVIDVGKKDEKDVKDFGDYEVKRAIDGGLAATREAIYRYMPSENDPDVGQFEKSEKERKKPNRLSMLKPRLNNERTNAIRMNVRNPFRVPQKTMKLKYLY
jgi:hypothetical protein